MLNMTLQDAMDIAPNWDEFCDAMGLNPYCVNEGGGDCQISISLYKADRLGLIKLRNPFKHATNCIECCGQIEKDIDVCEHCGAKQYNEERS